MSENRIAFTPIYGDSSKVNQASKRAGQLFFETDTGKIFLDIDENARKIMGGTSLYYSSQGGVGDEIPRIDEYYGLRKDSLEIDSSAMLKAGDLIVGADGSFYRIVDSDSINYLCNRMTIGSTGGGASVFYSEEETINVDEDNEGFYLLTASDVIVADGSRIKEDDLIIGLDNAFYRVSEILDNNLLRCTRLAIAGGGGGGGAGVSPKAKIHLSDEDTAIQYLINGKTATMRVWAESGKDPDDGEPLDTNLIVHWSLSEKKLGETTYEEYEHGDFPIVASTSDNPIWETFEYGTKARPSTSLKLTFYVTGSNSQDSRTSSHDFFTSELRLTPHDNFNNVSTFTAGNVTIYCSAIGSLDKFIYYYFETNGIEECLNPNGTFLSKNAPAECSIAVPAELATHGMHKVRIELYQSINDKPDFNSAATPLEMEIAVVDPEDTRAIIWLGDYQDEYYQYDSIKIPFRVYDPSPSAQLGATITLFKDNRKLGTRTISDSNAFSIWEIVDADLGLTNSYVISCGEEDNEARREITFRVVEDVNRAGMKIATGGLRYLFDASGRSNSESPTNRIKSSYTNSNGVTISGQLEGFNWYNNGWIMDSETGNTCLRISNGAVVRIPVGATTFAAAETINQSHTFEFQFKVRNVQDYSSIVHNITRYQGNTEPTHGPAFPQWTDEIPYAAFINKTYLEWSDGKVYDNYDAFLSWFMPKYYEMNIDEHPELDGTWPPSYDDLEYRETEKILNTNYAAGRYYDGQHGICIGAQDAIFTNGVNTVNVSYVEDKIVNLTIVYSHGDPDANQAGSGSNRLMSIYLNGVLTGVDRSTANSSWDINEANIVFDSRYCDFDLYKIRVYDQPLTLSAVLTNYMVDLKDPVGYDLAQLAVLNTTIGESQLVYDKMLQYNDEHPDGYIMPYIVFTTKEESDNTLPFSKSKKITDVQIEFVNTGLERAYTKGELDTLANKAQQTVDEYYAHHCPSWKGSNITMQVQGTSSEFYPRRNYKIKTKDGDGNINMYMNRGPFASKYRNPDQLEDTHLKFFYMDNDTVGTTKFTMKIDYMESSGTYNMGFANLVKNAYSHHPLDDYNSAGAFVVEDPETTTEVIATTYTEGTSYWYRNHKGNWKEAAPERIEDNLQVASAEDFAKGPWQLAQEQQLGDLMMDKVKVAKEGEEGYNTWYIREAGYKVASVANTEDYRTSVQGFPVLAFHEKTNANGERTDITFIGRYNMLLDKGSDEAFGFKPATKVFSRWIKDNVGRPKSISDIAECWEAENNSRGFCSFRDAAIARDASDTRFFETDTLTASGAPIVADYWEYRYHSKADSLDIIYDLKNNKDSEKSQATVRNELGIEIGDPEIITAPDGKFPEFTRGMKNAGDAMLELYSNWERAVKWVYGTDQAAVPSMGAYSEVDLGLEAYAPNTYYILDNNDEYVLDEAQEYNSSKIYYKLINEEYEPIKLCASNDLIYQPNTYYILTSLGDYVLDPETSYNSAYVYYRLVADEEHSGATQLPAPVVYNNHTYNYDTKEYRNAKFVNDLSKHFNLEYLVTYFVMTEVFECYDSRGKNCMFASWGPQEEHGDYIWYPIFYDIDTQLGINNTGIPSFEYYVDATENGTFSTNDSLLWNNLYKNFRGLIIQKYRQLRDKVSSVYPVLSHAPLKDVDRIEKWYLADPVICNSIAMRGERPLIAINLDEYYKYITITNAKCGYQDRNNSKNPVAVDNGTYFYALQGDRSLSRQQFLTNRLNYIDSWLNQGNYERGGTNIIRGRIAANSPSNTSDRWIEGENANTEPTLVLNSPYWTNGEKTHLFDGEYWITMEPVRNSYVTVGTDAANFPSLKYNNLEGPVRFETPDLENGVRTSGGYHEQLYYIYGLDQMKSLGDMSKLYWTEFNIEGSAKKMVDLLLGYDGLDENNGHYKNENINMYGIHASNTAGDGGGMPLLKKINMSYIKFKSDSPTYNFTSCEKLEDFRAIGSNIANVSFADGVALNTLYLPDTIKMLQLTEATKLNNIVTTLVERKDAENIDVTPGLYIPGLTDAGENTPTTKIELLSLIGDCLGYDSYKLLKNYVEARKGIAASSKVTLTEVDWSPYKQLDEGAVYDPDQSATYFVDDGHYGFAPYQHTTTDNWILKIKNGELYQYDTSLASESELITDTSLLDNLINYSNFISTADTNNAVPIITGIVYINNETAIDEEVIEKGSLALGHNGLATNYPNLKIFFKHVTPKPAAKYVILNNDGTYDLLARRTLSTGETFFPNPLTFISSNELDRYDTRAAYDFYGWSTEPLSPNAVEALNDMSWFTQDKGHLITTTNSSTSAALTPEEQYDNWSSQELVEGQNDYVFYAVYGIHKYVITYYDGNNKVLERVYVPAGQSIVDNPPKKAPYKELTDSSLENIEMIYKHIGWAYSPDATTPLEWTNAAIGNANRDRTVYPVFAYASVYDNVLSDTYLTGVEEGTQVYLKIKPGYTVRGKITLPATFNGKHVNGVVGGSGTDDVDNGFAYNNELTAIFWERGATPTTYRSFAFYNCGNLMWVDFPASLTTLGRQVFYQNRLINRDFSHCTALTTLNSACFNTAFGLTNDPMLKLPNSIRTIGSYAFAYNVNINTIQFGEDSYTQDGVVVPAKYWDNITASGIANDAFSDTNNLCPFNLIIYTSDENYEVWSMLSDWVLATGHQIQLKS